MTIFIPSDIVELILSLSKDDMYTVFSVTSKYWYDRSRSPTARWWERRYLQLGGYLPKENTIPLKILYDQIKPRYADVLVTIDGDKVKTYDIPLSVRLMQHQHDSSNILIETCEQEYLRLSNGDVIDKISNYTNMDTLYTEGGTLYYDNKLILLEFKLKKNYKNFLLSDEGKLYYIYSVFTRGFNLEVRIDHIDIPPVKDVVTFEDSAYCLTYNQKIYKVNPLSKDVRHKITVKHVPNQPISIKGDHNKLYLISDDKIYYMETYAGYTDLIDLLPPVTHITGYHDHSINSSITYYTSKNKAYRYTGKTGEKFEYLLDLKYTVSLACKHNVVYILGKK